MIYLLISILLSFILSIVFIFFNCKIVFKKITIKTFIIFFIIIYFVSLITIIVNYYYNSSIDYLLIVYFIILISIGIVDHFLLIIPDFYNLSILIMSIIIVVVKYCFNSMQYFHSTLDFVLGIVVMTLLFVVLLIIARKKEILGFGDIKLLFGVGILVGLINVLIIIFIACFMALLFEGIVNHFKRRMLPFGPYLVTSIMIIILFHNLLDKLLFL